MPVAKPTDVPRWADGGTNTPTNVVDPPEHNGSIAGWAPGPYTVGTFVGRGGNYYIVTGIAGTGTSTTGPVGTGATTDNPGANQVVWGWVTTTPVTKDSGWLPNTQPPAQWFNWLFNLIYQWVLWIQDLANQNFTGGSVGPWTGLHQFTGGVGTTAPITIEAGISTSGGPVPGIDSTGGRNGAGNPGPGVKGTGGLPILGATGAPGLAGYGSGSGEGLYAEGGPTGNGATIFGGLGGFGIEVAGTGTLATIKVTCTTSLGAQGADIAGDPSGGNGGTATGGAGSAVGWIGLSSGSGPGLAGVSFGTGAGVQGVASTGNSGILGQSATAQDAGSFANTSTGVAGRFSATTGEAINAFNNSNSLPCVSVENDGTAPCLLLSQVGAGTACTVTSAGPGIAVTAHGTAVSGTNTLGGPGVSGTGASTGSGVGGVGGSGGGNGVTGSGGGSFGSGVEGFGTSTGAGVTGANLAGGPGFEAANAFILLFGNNGFIAQRIGAGPNANATINPWEKDTWIIPVLSANTTWALAPPPGGQTVRFKIRQLPFSPAQLHTLTVTIGITVATFSPGSPGPNPSCVEWEFDPGTVNGWAVINKYDPGGNVGVA